VDAARRVAAIPTTAALEHGQDRLAEKELFRCLGIATARFGSLGETGVPALVKSRRLGYDGKGQRRVEVEEALSAEELAEEIVRFDRELSIVAVRGHDGDTCFYPLTENEHRGGILAVSRAPAADAPQGEAEAIATRLLDALEYVGVLAVELFEVDGRLLANEFAPRVHNTGHWTIDGAATSQFENHVRAVLGLPLGSTEPLGESVMVNIVGDVPSLDRLLAVPGAHVHLYGKPPRTGRKLGHVTLLDADDASVADVTGLAASAWRA
jgi:5-(carboxyamino)imidazole ribonucleotide synthase